MENKKNQTNGLFCHMIESSDLQNTITKIYSNTNILSDIWFQLPLQELAKLISYYNDALCDANIKLPKLNGVKVLNSNIEITQEFIGGINIRNIINQYCRDFKNIDLSIPYFEKLIEIQLQSYKNDVNLRVDLNIDNFIVNDDDNLYLVDVTPPLYIGNIDVKNDNIKVQRYLDLCFCIWSQIAELINNWLKYLVKNQSITSSYSSLYQLDSFANKLIFKALDLWSDTDLSNHIKDYFDQILTLDYFELRSDNYSLKRLWLIKLLLNKRIKLEEFYIEYSNLSLTKGLG